MTEMVKRFGPFSIGCEIDSVGCLAIETPEGHFLVPEEQVESMVDHIHKVLNREPIIDAEDYLAFLARAEKLRRLAGRGSPDGL